MPAFTQLLAGLCARPDGTVSAIIPDDWMQGRTTYGGLTAALSLDAAQRMVEDLPVRAAQVAFVGPVAGEVILQGQLLRRGKNTAFVGVDVISEGAIAARSIFAFGQARTSALSFVSLEAPNVAAPYDLPAFFKPGRSPAFAEHFDVRLAFGSSPVSGAPDADIGLWIRHIDETAGNDGVALLALADAPPPAALSMLSVPAPISSMTWMAEFLTDTRETTDGWWLSRSTAQTAAHGYSSQAMTMWNRDGEPVMVGRQTVAVFG